MGSETKCKVAKNDVEVSCWNCFTVEDEDRDAEPLSLYKIRKEHRNKFKLYSFLASELVKPKTVSLKQKVCENYTVGKRLEEKINKVSTCNYHTLGNIDERENSKIVHKVQVEKSPPVIKRRIKRNSKTLISSDNEIYNVSNDSNLTIPGYNLSQIHKEAAVADNTSSNGSESGYAGSFITVQESNESENNKSSPASPATLEHIELKTKSSPELNKPPCIKFKSSLPTLHLTKSSTLTTSTKSLCIEPVRKPVKSLRWSTICVDQEEVSLSDDEVYVTDTVSPGHATLPRRSNSPLPNERDMLDRDRFPINRSGLQARSESMASVYSGAGEGTRCNVTVRGEVQFSLLYNYRLGALEVGVKRCRDLASVDTKRNRSDPYVKVYLLPDKSKAGKRKTKVKKNTLNPVFEETLSFVQPLASLSSRTLWLSVWHADMFGRNDFLGEVTLPLADVVFDDPAPTWHKLHERTEQFEEQQGTRGDLHVGLKFEVSESRGAAGAAKGTLHVLVKEAKHLAATKPQGLADVFCKSYLLPERGRLAKQKTGVARRTLNPRWEHAFTYRGLRRADLAERALELSLWDRDRLASNDFMGAIRLSLGTGTYMGSSVNWMDSVGKEVSLWQTMMERPNFWVEGSLPLRPQLNN